MQQNFKITGMSCAACVSRVEKAVTRLPGVTEAAVSLLTGAMRAETADNIAPDTIINAVKAAGYGCVPVSGNAPEIPETSDISRHLKNRLIVSLALLLPLLLLVWPPPFVREFAALSPLASGFLQGILAAAVIIVNRSIIGGGVRALFRLSPDMNSLIATGVMAGFGWSCIMLLVMADLVPAPLIPKSSAVPLYFESGAMILTLVTLGKLLESGARDKTLNSLRGLMSMNPDTAQVFKNGAEITMRAADMVPGDIFIVRPGERIPGDGTVISGSGSVNEAALTGEALPVFREPGSQVKAATVVLDGCLTCRAENTGFRTAFYRIITLLKEAQASRAPIARTADKIAGVFVPVVLTISLVTLLAWLLSGAEAGFALNAAIAVLVISCPCALGLATPVSVVTGSGVAAKHGILFKSAAALETAGRLTAVIFDKTGTLTTGEISITAVKTLNGTAMTELLRTAYLLENKSEHPLARALVSFAEEKLRENAAGKAAAVPDSTAVSDFKSFPGLGVSAAVNGNIIRGGSYRFLSREITDLPPEPEEASQSGESLLYFASGNTILGYFTAADTLKKGVRDNIAELRRMGIETLMLTGDHEPAARKAALAAGISEYRAELLPEDKAGIIRDLNKSHITAMTGDGINDAVALKTAHLGIAMGSGTAIAADAADAVILNSRLNDLVTAVKLGRTVLNNIRENLFWAFIYNALGIPLAAGCFYSLLGFQMNPVFAAMAMSLSSITVVGNALRLNFFHQNNGEHQKMNITGVFKKVLERTPELQDNQILLRISGMKCEHCERAVRKALEELPEVTAAEVSHKKGQAVLTISGEIAEDRLRAAITESGFELNSLSGKPISRT